MVQTIEVAYLLVAVFFGAMALIERERKRSPGPGIRPAIAALLWPVSLAAVAVHLAFASVRPVAGRA